MCLGLVVGDAVWELISPTQKKQKAFVKKVDDTKVSTTTDNKTKITRLVILGVAIPFWFWVLLSADNPMCLQKR